jgi:hypothetical protein
MQMFNRLTCFRLFLNRQVKRIRMEGSQKNPYSLRGSLKKFRPSLLAEVNKTCDMIPGDNQGMAGQHRSNIIHSKKMIGFQENTFPDLRAAKRTGHKEK